MRRFPNAVVKEIAPDAVRKAFILMNTNGDDLLTLDEAWEFVKTKCELREISREFLKEMFFRISRHRNKEHLDYSDMLVGASERYPRSREHYKFWLAIIKCCNPAGARLETGFKVSAKHALDATLLKDGTQYRVITPIDDKALPLKPASVGTKPRSDLGSIRTLSPLRSHSSLVTYDYLIGSQSPPRYLTHATQLLRSPGAATTSTKNADDGAHPPADDYRDDYYPTTNEDQGYGMGTDSDSSPMKNTASTLLSPTGQKIRIKRYVGNKERLIALAQKKEQVLQDFKRTATIETESDKVRHPFPFATKFKMVDPLTFKHDRTGFYAPGRYTGCPGMYEPRSLVDPPDKPAFVSKFRVPTNADLRAEQGAVKSEMALVKDEYLVKRPPSPPNFDTRVPKRSKDQAMTSGEFFPFLGKEKKLEEEDLTVEETRILKRKAERLGFKFVPVAHGPRDTVTLGRVHHPTDWRTK